jgi:hypothetical protein
MNLILVSLAVFVLAAHGSDAPSVDKFQDFLMSGSLDNLLGALNLEALSETCRNQTQLLRQANPVTTLTDSYWNLKSEITLLFLLY